MLSEKTIRIVEEISPLMAANVETITLVMSSSGRKKISSLRGSSGVLVEILT